MSNLRLLLAGALGTALLAAPAAFAQSTMDNAKTGLSDTLNKAKEKTVGRRVELSSVPASALAAAHKEIGTNLTEANQEQENGKQVYEIEGKDAANNSHSIHVTADGTVLRKN